MAKLGEFLIQKGILTREQFDIVLHESQKNHELIGQTLVRLKFVTQDELLSSLAEQLGLAYFPDLKSVTVPPEVIKAIPAKLVHHYKFMPLKISGKVLTVAVSDPSAVWLMEDLKLHLGYDVERGLATDDEITAAIRHYYGLGADTIDEILKQEKAAAQELPQNQEIEEVDKGAQVASVIKLVNQILSEAVNANATDIHCEPFRNRVRVRYRIDGILYDMRLPEQIRLLYPAVVSRIKILSNLNVVERRLPQDGRAIIKIQEKQVDLRISIIPSLDGESMVIRILPIHLLFSLDSLGLFPEDLKKIESLMEKPHGILFLCGPTGSGKTTTLYASLSKLNKDAVKIITIEDPIEYELPGITQLQARPEIGLTFAAMLRSVLRHDPDIMMVGEVRDLETAELAIRTSLTGHLIFSTLHTNDAASGATRLLDIGIEPYLVASSVNAFISQRLIRTICPFCKEEIKDTELLPPDLKNVKVYHGKGCENCNFIGYKGRTAIYEILLVEEPIQELIVKKASAAQIRKKASELGNLTLRDAGIRQIKLGRTSPEEVFRVVSREGE